MSYTYWLHEKIQTDFNEGFAWYENKKKGLGFEFLNEIEGTINKIVAHPGSFGSKGNPLYREALLKGFPYVIVYRIYSRKKEIFISALHHTSKSPRKKYRRP
ncbi:MAG TPA: hypothetical protein VFI29_20625 [Hanamia sp.]|jgi:hypothetical protein|nr:hypothetical protein [Hanamia sp.]